MTTMKNKFLTKNIKIKTISEAEAKAKGLGETEKVQKESGKFNKEGIDTYTKLKDLYKFDEGEEDALENPPKTTREDDLDGYEVAAKGAGKLQGIRYDNEDTETFKQFMERIDALNDDSEYKKEFGTHDGFGEGDKDNVYDELKEKGQEYIDYKYGEKYDEVEDEYQETPRVRTTKNESAMKRLNFKQEFKDEKHMMSLIKESYKVDNHIFLMADGNQTYKVRWEGDDKSGEAVSLLYKNENKINESKEMMKKLSNYKSSDVVGKTNNYINEKVEFNKMFDIIRGKKILKEDNTINFATGEEVETPLLGGKKEEKTSWCRRFVDGDWYMDELKSGKSYLKNHDCGEAVKMAQEFINDYKGSEVLKVDSAYGSKTIRGVKEVQGELNLKPDGLYGKKTHDAIVKATGAGLSPGRDRSGDVEIEKIDTKPAKTIDTKVSRDIPPTNSDDNDFELPGSVGNKKGL